MTYHVLIPDHMHAAAVELLEQAEGITVTAPGSMEREEALAAAASAVGLIVRSSTRVDAEMLSAAPKLRVVVRAGAGVDNVDLDAATARGVIVMNTPGANTISTAEHTFALMLALARHIPRAHQSLAEGRWDRKQYEGVELSGKVLGIIGLGRVGRAVARRALAFGMRVLAYQPNAHEPCDGVQEVKTLDELFREADFISLHPSLTDQTRSVINAETLAKMKPGVYLINTARGGLVVEEDLADAIRRGHVAGAALDVYSSEPPSPDNPLIGLPNVVHTPHLGASTTDAQRAVAVQAAEQMIDALLRGEYRHVRNQAVLGTPD